MTTPPESASETALQAALDALFAAPFPDFVTERKRLVAELRAAGQRAAATALGKVNRPTLASWTINQLVRQDPAELDALFSAAHRIRLGDFSATADHRTLLARLHGQALELLRAAGQPTSDATLRRITTTLQALSAHGGFAPDLPGRLIDDRDPPGFDAMDLALAASGAPPSHLTLLPTTPAPTKPAPPAAAPPVAAAPTTPAPTTPAPTTPAPTPPAIGSEADAAAAPSPAARPRPQLVVMDGGARSAQAEPAPAGADSVAPPDADADGAGSDAEAAALAAEAAAAEQAAAAAAAVLAAAQAAAVAAAARVQQARQRSRLEELRAKQRRLTGAILDHEQAIAVLEKDLEQRRKLLESSRREVAPLQAELEALAASLGVTLDPSAPSE